MAAIRIRSLPLRALARRHYGLTDALGRSFTEAARVCLDRHHEPPVAFRLRDGSMASEFQINWNVADSRTNAAYANETDATRDGAYAILLAAVEATRGLYAIARAETLTGADYYVAPQGARPDDLEDCVRLEVSGVARGRDAVVEARLRQKLDQASKGISSFPAIAGVVGFEARLILLANLEER